MHDYFLKVDIVLKFDWIFCIHQLHFALTYSILLTIASQIKICLIQRCCHTSKIRKLPSNTDFAFFIAKFKASNEITPLGLIQIFWLISCTLRRYQEAVFETLEFDFFSHLRSLFFYQCLRVTEGAHDLHCEFFRPALATAHNSTANFSREAR